MSPIPWRYRVLETIQLFEEIVEILGSCEEFVDFHKAGLCLNALLHDRNCLCFQHLSNSYRVGDFRLERIVWC